uniref:Uncharacterized protein n=1 Tax=Knipowitschia caucasica TaxID=637954 RepID=A0AAV2KT14_KNICA
MASLPLLPHSSTSHPSSITLLYQSRLPSTPPPIVYPSNTRSPLGDDLAHIPQFPPSSPTPHSYKSQPLAPRISAQTSPPRPPSTFFTHSRVSHLSYLPLCSLVSARVTWLVSSLISPFPLTPSILSSQFHLPPHHSRFFLFLSLSTHSTTRRSSLPLLIQSSTPLDHHPPRQTPLSHGPFSERSSSQLLNVISSLSSSSSSPSISDLLSPSLWTLGIHRKSASLLLLSFSLILVQLTPKLQWNWLTVERALILSFSPHRTLLVLLPPSQTIPPLSPLVHISSSPVPSIHIALFCLPPTPPNSSPSAHHRPSSPHLSPSSSQTRLPSPSSSSSTLPYLLSHFSPPLSTRSLLL